MLVIAVVGFLFMYEAEMFDSRFAFWIHRSAPLLGPIVLMLVLLWARWKGDHP